MYFSQIVFHIFHEVVDNAFGEGGFEGWLCQTGLSLPHYKTSSTRPLQGRRWFKMQFVCTLIKAGKDKRMSGDIFIFKLSDFSVYLFLVSFSSPFHFKCWFLFSFPVTVIDFLNFRSPCTEKVKHPTKVGRVSILNENTFNTFNITKEMHLEMYLCIVVSQWSAMVEWVQG